MRYWKGPYFCARVSVGSSRRVVESGQADLTDEKNAGKDR